MKHVPTNLFFIRKYPGSRWSCLRSIHSADRRAGTVPNLNWDLILYLGGRRAEHFLSDLRYPGLRSIHSADRRAGTVTKYPQWAHLYVFEIADNYSE